MRDFPTRDARGMVEDVLKCKWSLRVLALVRAGVNRPGAMVKATPGLTTKVLNQRLRKLQGYGILWREVLPEIPPHVRYGLTPFGARFVEVIDAIEGLQRQIADEEAAPGERPAGNGSREPVRG